MKTITFLFSLLFLFSCSKRGTLDKYYQIVDSSNKVVYYTKINGVFIITREATVDEHLQTSKNILKRNIKPEEQRNITPTNKIEIYKNEKVIGTLLISDFVNFNSANLKFGFRLTYGIGMSL